MLERMLVSRIEHRLIIASLCFFALMVILAWVALNENYRMNDYDKGFKAQAVEMGADLYLKACAVCHGYDGLGEIGRAPALNNPQLFGHNFFPDITKQEAGMAQEAANLIREQRDLDAKLADPSTNQTDKDAANTRLQQISDRLTEITRIMTQLDAQRMTAAKPAVAKGYDPTHYDRIRNVNWSGTRDKFIFDAISAGRPTSFSYWPQQMPAWGDGSDLDPPLRQDQMEDITAYIMNWDKGDNWTLDDLFAVKQFAIEPVDAAPLIKENDMLRQYAPSPVNTNITDILRKLPAYDGNADRGNDLYHGKAATEVGAPILPCFACHTQTADGTGPETNGTYTRILKVRLKDPKLAGYTADQYIVESIVQPDAYIAPGFVNIMPEIFGSELSMQDMADLVAYIHTLQ